MRTFRSYAEGWIKTRESLDYSTAGDQANHLRVAAETFGEQPLASIRPAHVQRYAQWIRSQSRWAPRTQRNYLRTLIQMLNDAAAEDLITPRRWLRKQDWPREIDADPAYRREQMFEVEECEALVCQ